MFITKPSPLGRAFCCQACSATLAYIELIGRAITRRTITPLLWDLVARVVMGLVDCGVIVLLERLSDAGTWPIGLAGFSVLVVLNVFAGLLPVRVAIRRIQADARRRLDAQS